MAPVLVDDVGTCRAAADQLLEERLVAVDIEGVQLGRAPGKICVVQIVGAAERTVYLFDVTVLGDTAFCNGLQELLEDDRVQKVFWDVRSDCDALHHNHNVAVRNAFDLQVLCQLKFYPQAPYLNSLKKALLAFGKTQLSEAQVERMESEKEAGVCLFSPDHGGSFAVWERRPLDKRLIAYCSVDVKYLLDMKALWDKPKLNQLVLEITPQRIADFVMSPSVSQESKKGVDFRHLVPAGLKAELPAGMVEQTVRIPSGRVGLVIGRGGSTIQRIEAMSGASVSIAKGEGTARVLGTPSEVDSAVLRIAEAMR